MDMDDAIAAASELFDRKTSAEAEVLRLLLLA